MFDPIAYPNLKPNNFVVRSPKSPKYNCIAWAAGDSRRWWWPSFGYYWPDGVQHANTMDAFIQAFGTLGYVACDDKECVGPPHEAGVERIAIYAIYGVPKHAARQMNERWWTSKMGANIDLEHTLSALEGPFYGSVRKILKRTVPQRR